MVANVASKQKSLQQHQTGVMFPCQLDAASILREMNAQQ
jgi:hypothetical protein